MDAVRHKRRTAGVPSEALTVRLPVEMTEWLRDTAHEERRSQALIVEEALKRYRESG